LDRENDMTIQAEQTVGEIAAASLAAVRVFEKHGIDFCCGGKRPLGETCRQMGIDAAALRAELEAALAGPKDSEKDWTTAPLAELVQYIQSKHHEYLKQELPRIHERLEKVMRVYGERGQAPPQELPQVYSALRQELEGHLQKEEMILFPFIEQNEAASRTGGAAPHSCFGTIRSPLRVMEAEHDSAGEALRKMRRLANDYVAPEYACNTYRAMLGGLHELEQDLHAHIHLENNILFPRALALETQQSVGATSA